MLRQKLYKLKQEQGVESEPLFPILKQEPPSPGHRYVTRLQVRGLLSPRPSSAKDLVGAPGRLVPNLLPSGPAQPSPFRSLEPEDPAPTPPGPSSEGGSGDPEAEGAAPAEGEAVLMEEDLIQQSLDDYDAGKYSPRLLTAHELPLDAHVLEPDEDAQRLQLSRQQLQVTGAAGGPTLSPPGGGGGAGGGRGQGPPPTPSPAHCARPAGDASESAEDIFFRRAKEGMGQDEAQFSVEMPLTGKAYLWADKYRPRKPRFFNRVHTGFEWNKYNQTHYDFDNPPPKIVQGYKFNIFYPDLIDKRSTPEYFLEACADNKDFATLRFHAGPPYEDIAFKIVSREWEYSHRHGFRCQFANGIFQLWFHFKRYRYRR